MKHSQLRQLIRESIKKEYSNENTLNIFKRTATELENNLPDGPITEENWPAVEAYILHVWEYGGSKGIKGAPVPEGYSFEEYKKAHSKWPTNALAYHDNKMELTFFLQDQYGGGTGGGIPDNLKRRG